jgi:hypothetical protein
MKQFRKQLKEAIQRDKRKPIGNYWLEIENGNVILHTKGKSWSDPARAMSHLMKLLTELDE